MKPQSKPVQRGFSLLELLIVVAILTIVTGVVFGYVSNMQKGYRSEETKVDTTQEGREFIDQITRDLHQAGFPNRKMYAAGVLGAPPENDARNAVGLVKVSNSEIWFEGDLDGDGQVESVRYTLMDTNGNPVAPGGNCPCSLRRSVTLKITAAPMAQVTNYNSSIDGIINSGGAAAAGAPLTIAGTTRVGGSAGTTVNNDVLFAAYKTPPLFAAFDQNGNAVALPTDFVASPVTLATIRSIQVTVNLLGRFPDMRTNVPPVIPLGAASKLITF